MAKYTNADITTFIEQGENAELEFKRDDERPEKIAREIVAFANLRGGILLLGVEDKGEKISGLTKKNIQEWMMDTVIGRYVKPQIEVELEVVTLADKQIAVIEIPKGIARPYALVHNDREDYYIRRGDTCQLIQRQELIRLFESGGHLHSETFPVPGTDIQNLHEGRIKEYFFQRLGFSPQDDLNKLLENRDFLVKSGDDKYCLSIFALALFGRDILSKLPQASLRFTVYEGEDKDYSPLLDEQLDLPTVEYRREVTQQILEPALHHHHFFQSHLSEEQIIEGTRQRIWHYPPLALRELIVNALVHRDWTKNDCVRVVAYSNRLEIISPGGLHNGMTVEKIKLGDSLPRNPKMARVMRDYGYVEQQGMGIRRTVIPQMLDENGCEPEFIADEDSFTVILYKGVSMKRYLDATVTNDKTYSSFFPSHNTLKEVNKILEKKQNLSGQLTTEDKAERVAIQLGAVNRHEDDDLNWGTYYSPLGIFFADEKGVIKYPSVDQYVDEDKLVYWKERAGETESFLLKSHYADLVVDFSPVIKKTKELDIDLIKTVIDSNIKICELSLLEPLHCQRKIKRALDLAIKIDDKERIEKVKTAIINLEKKIPIDSELLGLWGYSFRWLMLDNSQKANLSPEEKKDLITDLKARLEAQKKTLLIGGAYKHVCLLVEYYVRENNEKEFFNVLKKLETSLKNLPLSETTNILKHSMYENVLNIYKKYQNSFPQAREAYQRLLKEISEIDLTQSLKTLSFPVDIKKEEFDSFCKGIFGENNGSSLEEVLTKVMEAFLLDKDFIKKDMERSKRTNFFTSLFTKQNIGSDGRTVSKIPTLDLKKIAANRDLSKEKNYDINLIHHYSFQLHIQNIFLNPIMQQFKERFSKEDLLNYFQTSIIFEDDNKPYLEAAMTAYWENNHLIASHLFMPLIERSIRNLIKMGGGRYLKANDIGGYDYLSLGKLFENNEHIFKGIYGERGEDVLFYFRVALTEKAGLNLRNHFAHGLEERSFFSPIVSDRLFHILIFLLVIKVKNP